MQVYLQSPCLFFLYAAQSGKHLHSYCRADTVKDERCNVTALWSEVNHKSIQNLDLYAKTISL